MHLTKATQQKALYNSGICTRSTDAQDCLRCRQRSGRRGALLPHAGQAEYLSTGECARVRIGADQRLTWETDPVTRVSADALLSGLPTLRMKTRRTRQHSCANSSQMVRMLQSDVEHEGKVSGWSLPQLRRAQERGAVPKKAGFHKGWQWLLKACDTGSPEDDAPPEDDASACKCHLRGTRDCKSFEIVLFSKVTGGVTFAPSPAPPSGLPSSSPEPRIPTGGRCAMAVDVLNSPALPFLLRLEAEGFEVATVDNRLLVKPIDRLPACVRSACRRTGASSYASAGV